MREESLLKSEEKEEGIRREKEREEEGGEATGSRGHMGGIGAKEGERKVKIEDK